MSKIAIFIDGEYLRKIANKQGYSIDVPFFVKWVMEKRNVKEQDFLRTYYYTSPPYQGSKPTDDEKERYSKFQKFLNFLKRQNSFELRLGRTEKRGPRYEQKMVDVLLSVDLVYLGSKGKIFEAILIAGDSDFVPAINKIKDEGVKATLICSSDPKEYHQHLRNQVDISVLLTKVDIKECSKNN